VDNLPINSASLVVAYLQAIKRIAKFAESLAGDNLGLIALDASLSVTKSVAQTVEQTKTLALEFLVVLHNQ
jgi:hypothetical protein